MNIRKYIIFRSTIFAELTWDLNQITAAQDEGLVLADVIISEFNPKHKDVNFLATFADNGIHYTLLIQPDLHDGLRTKCLLGLKPELSTQLHYIKA